MEYKNGYVAFIDILGFSSYVSDEKNASGTYELFEFVRNFCNLFNSSPESNIEVSFFSDSIVLTSDKLEKLVSPIYIAESYLKDKPGLLFRGGICYGKYYHNNGVTFGPAVIAAYKLEGKANYSRIILHPSIQIQDGEDLIFYNDMDGYLCLNPMSNVFSEALAFTDSKEELPQKDVTEIINGYFLKLRENLTEQIQRNVGTPVIDKYMWRVRVFNYTCKFIMEKPDGELRCGDLSFTVNEKLRSLLKKQVITDEEILAFRKG